QVFLILEFRALQLDRVDHAGERNSRRALHVIIVYTVFVAVTLQQMDGVHSGPVLEMDAAFRKHLLYRLHELVNEGIEFLRGRALPGWACKIRTQKRRRELSL